MKYGTITRPLKSGKMTLKPYRYAKGGFIPPLFQPLNFKPCKYCGHFPTIKCSNALTVVYCKTCKSPLNNEYVRAIIATDIVEACLKWNELNKEV